ncbi:MAG: CvpA family protein [Terracidiphilus sp.]|jgi:membrane protein required for colicin V production
MEWVDCVILAILVGAVLGGIAQGFFRTACSLLGLILGIAVASWNYARVAVAIKPLVWLNTVADAIAFLLIAVVVMILANFVGIALSKIFNWMGLGCIDTLGGGIVGFLQGALLVAICVLVTVAFLPQTEWLARARLPRYFIGALHLSTHMTPDELSGRVREGLKTLKHETPQWMHEKSGAS